VKGISTIEVLNQFYFALGRILSGFCKGSSWGIIQVTNLDVSKKS